MVRRASTAVVLGLLASCFPAVTWAQTTLYHLHKELSATSSVLDQLKKAAPEAAATWIASADLKGTLATDFMVKRFDTQAALNEPNIAGVLPAQSEVTFNIWLKKSANWDERYPEAKLVLNDESGT